MCSASSASEDSVICSLKQQKSESQESSTISALWFARLGRRGGALLFWLLLVVVGMQLASQFSAVRRRRFAQAPLKELPLGFGDSVETPMQLRSEGWVGALELLRSSPRPYVVVNAKNGLGNRLRALASAMAVAEALNRPVMLIWVPDLHCNCGFRTLFAEPLRFVLLEEEIPQQNLTESMFQVYNYMRPEPGAVKDAPVYPDVRRHLYFKSAFLMNHHYGSWLHAQWHLKQLTPTAEVMRMVVATKRTIGLHVRNAFDAPRDERTNRSVVGAAAVALARKQYGATGTKLLLAWRRASHWSGFVSQIDQIIECSAKRRVRSAALRYPRFYLAADSEAAYEGLIKQYNDRLMYTRRKCTSQRCDFRDCGSLVYSLVDMLNLARTKLILGSGWSSYSEVAAYWGGEGGRPVPMLLAGRDFGEILGNPRLRMRLDPATCVTPTEVASDGSVGNMGLIGGAREEAPTADAAARPQVQRDWAKPF
mmetsp:Transcript_8608/g.18732  ORF Transcript_8608/g.18732 Transcript_8608/m.18732 type:complete len:480 (+) Transcript_8608:481-1920(+)